MSAELIGFATLYRKEVRRFFRVAGQTVMSPLINATLYLLVFGVSLSRVVTLDMGASYLEFLVPGLMALSSLNNALQNSSSSLMVSKFHGDLQDLKLVPLSMFSVAAAYVSASMTRALIVACAVLFIGEIFAWFVTGSLIVVLHPLWLLIFLLIGGFIFGNLGIWIGFLSKSFDQINAFTNFVILPLIYLGGVFFSLDILHPFWRQLSSINPLVYLIGGIRWSVLEISDFGLLGCLLPSLGFAAVSFILALYSVRFGSYQRF